jgi:hypothetical protein
VPELKPIERSMPRGPVDHQNCAFEEFPGIQACLPPTTCELPEFVTMAAPANTLQILASIWIKTSGGRIGGRPQLTMAEGSADTSSIKVAQTQLNQGLIQNLPSESVNAALSSILTLATPGVAADSNGVFHLLGEHAEPPT